MPSPLGSDGKQKKLKLALELNKQSNEDLRVDGGPAAAEVYYDGKARVLPSEFATSSNAKLIALLNNQSTLPMIQGSGKFSYGVPILPKPKPKPEDSFFRSKRRFRRSTTIQYYE